MNLDSFFSLALKLSQTPTGQDVLDALGHLATTIAAHNKQHLGSADAIVADAGAVLTTLGEPAAA